MKILFIDACVREQSRTRVLCMDYIKKFMKINKGTLQTVSLSKAQLAPFDEEMLNQRIEDIAQGNLQQEKYSYARDFAEADFIIIGAPYWDCSFPAILKTYFEHICVNQLTFAYAADGRPMPLCKAGKLVYITTAGGYIGIKNTGEQYIRDLCEMYGILGVEVIRAEGLDIKGNEADAILQQVKDSIKII